ncbi:TPA: ZIP family metal transporter, partial [Candidatus Woesearchaeota archaeon]|nr:ZIP family metal transporter [Candidatus Woesearchaeota archaeon]
MMLWAWIFLSVLLVSLLSLISIFFLSFKKEFLHKLMAFLISFAAGALLGDAFLHLLPEAVEEAGFTLSLSLTLLAGIIIFFILEKFIHWRHCHIPASKEHPHPFAWMNLLGDALHNFMDGLIIAGSYLTSIPLGVSTTLAVVLHEIP